MHATEKDFQRACQIHAVVSSLYQKFLIAYKLRAEDAADGFAERIRRTVTPGLYEHWKSKTGDLKFYVVHHAFLEVDVHYPIVSYASLYGKRAGLPTGRHLLHKVGKNFSDADRGFLTPIDRSIYKGPRFRLVEKLSMHEMATLVERVGELMSIQDSIELRQHVGSLIKRNISTL